MYTNTRGMRRNILKVTYSRENAILCVQILRMRVNRRITESPRTHKGFEKETALDFGKDIRCQCLRQKREEGLGMGLLLRCENAEVL